MLSFVVVGIGFYGLVVFLDALVAEHGWDAAQVSGATTLYWMVAGGAGIVVGRGVDRFGARRFLVAGVVTMAVALVAIGRVDAPWQIYPWYALLAVGFAMAGSIPSGAIITRWFAARRGVAMMLAHTGVSLGGIVLVPLFRGWIAADGLGPATLRLAGLLLAVALPVLAFVVRGSPAPYGLAPDGGRGTPLDAAAAARDAAPWTRRALLATPAFRRLAAAFALMLFCQVAFAMHELAFLRVRIGAELAALAVSATAAGSFFGRLAVGTFSDRVDRRRLAAALFALQGATVALAAFGTGAPVLLVAAAGFGVTVGNIFLLQSLLVAELFGMASFGTALGLLQLVTQVASGTGPLALGLLERAHGAYGPALLWLVAGALVAAALVTTVRPPELPGDVTAPPAQRS